LNRTIELEYIVEKGRLYTFKVGGYKYGPWLEDDQGMWITEESWNKNRASPDERVSGMTVDWDGLYNRLSLDGIHRLPDGRSGDADALRVKVLDGSEKSMNKKFIIRNMLAFYRGIGNKKIADFYRNYKRKSNGLVTPVELSESDALIQETSDDFELNRDNVTRAAYSAVCSSGAPPRVQRRGITTLSRLLDPKFERRHLPAHKRIEWDDDRRQTLKWLRKFFEANDRDTHQIFLSLLKSEERYK